MENKTYYIGLDIGTDSVGYAASNAQYHLCKFRGEPVWGTTRFDAANLAEDRRLARTARRRLDRRQQRVALLEELFAKEIGKIDPNFFLRRRESALFAEDSQDGVKLFHGGLTDEEYHKRYPTIHHLLLELMESDDSHDIRCVYIACAWLVAHRGHFLFDTEEEKINDFHELYQGLYECFENEYEGQLPWPESMDADTLLDIMKKPVGVKQKTELFQKYTTNGKKAAKKKEDDCPYDRKKMVSLLLGGKVKPKELFGRDDYEEIESINLNMDEESFGRIVSELGNDGDVLRCMRSLYDCAFLTQTLDGASCISEAKVKVYEQHKKDLAYLKKFVRKYAADKYDLIFREEKDSNYVAYSGNVKSCRSPQDVKRANKEKFCDFLKKQLSKLKVEAAGEPEYKDMMDRLEQQTFLPKQRDSDNRIIPQQLYYAELNQILERAIGYVPLLSEKDENGISNADKIRMIFRFRVPYFVGPLNPKAQNSWLVREKGKIYPWNFDSMVDLDKSEQAFIQRMTNYCTYLPGEEVLPQQSLLYSRFMVLNEVNNLTVNGKGIPVKIKQEIVENLFETRRKITPKQIRDYLRSRGYLEPKDELGGIDVSIKSSLNSYHSFRRLLESGSLTEEQVEEIIRHAAYSEDKNRMERWLLCQYPSLSKEDRRYILHLKLKEFGRLSARFLTGIYHINKETGEARSIMDLLWEINDNLMQLLSERYDFKKQIDEIVADYYAVHPQTVSERLDDMYISNAVKRPILQSLKVTEEVVKAMGHAPDKIFIEMARDVGDQKKGQRTTSRKEQILALYHKIGTEEAKELEAELLAMGDMADNRLQGDKLFLYFMQFGRCIYTGNRIELSQLATNAYDIDHIYPQSKVQDDSILNNRVLCLSSANGAKSDRYPIDESIRVDRRGWWESLLHNHLIEKEKFNRLTRSIPFTEDELHQFINRQLVETRQSTKAVAKLLAEKYPDTQIVYVKAGLVSRFRQEYDVIKSRAVNDLHHAKDAYLNIVVGNVYHERFTKRWFDVKQTYSLNVKTLFSRPLTVNSQTIWRGSDDIALVKKMVAKNAVHLTDYAFCRKGGLFDQMPLKAGSGLVPRKANLPTEKYGGYNKTTASFYLLASYEIKGKKDIMFVPIELMYAEKVLNDESYANSYVAATISQIKGGKPIDNMQILLGGRKIKINTVIEADGMRMVLKGKCSKGTQMIVTTCMPLILGSKMEHYVKYLESFAKKQDKKKNPNTNIQPDAVHDHITVEENVALYDLLCNKLTDTVFAKCPGNIGQTVINGRERFLALSLETQVSCLLSIVSWFGAARSCDLQAIGGAVKAGAKVPSSSLSSWSKQYSKVCIVDQSASGLFRSTGENLLELL